MMSFPQGQPAWNRKKQGGVSENVTRNSGKYWPPYIGSGVRCGVGRESVTNEVVFNSIGFQNS
jgi:hypothetical protein